MTPEIESALDEHIEQTTATLTHKFSDVHNPWESEECSNVVCEWVLKQQDSFTHHDIKLDVDHWFLTGKGVWTFRKGLGDHHVGGVAQWFRQKLTVGQNDLVFLDSPAYPYALTLLLLYLRRKGFEQSGPKGKSIKRRKIDLEEMRRQALHRLVGDTRRLSPEPESENSQPTNSPEEMGFKVLQEAVIGLEKLMFWRGKKVRESCDEEIWGKDIGPHQEGVDLKGLSETLRTDEKNFKPMYDDKKLSKLCEVSIFNDFYNLVLTS